MAADPGELAEGAKPNADPSSVPAWVHDLATVREERREESRTSWAGLLAGSLAPAFLIFGIGMWLAKDHIVLATSALIVRMLVAITMVSPVAKMTRGVRDARRRRRTLDLLDARGETTLGGEYVAVAYTESLWHHPGRGHDVDNGVLQFDLDGLAFVGRASRFSLPSGAILDTEIRFFDAALDGPSPRTYVRWAFEGQSGTLSLALPNHRSVRQRVQEAFDLRQRIERWRTEPFPVRSSSQTQLPPVHSPMPRVQHPVQTGTVAKALALVATLAILGGFETVATLVAIQAGWERTGSLLLILLMVSPMAWSILNVKIERRLPIAWRHHGPELPVATDDVQTSIPKSDDEIRLKV